MSTGNVREGERRKERGMKGRKKAKKRESGHRESGEEEGCRKKEVIAGGKKRRGRMWEKWE